MFYCLYKLKFLTPLHVGRDSGSAGLEGSQVYVHSDTFISALYIESRKIGKENDFYGAAEDGKIAISSLFPYRGDELFLPKPIYAPRTDITSVSPEKYKLFKKLQYIPLSMFGDYLRSLRGEGLFDAGRAHEQIKSVARVETRTNVAIQHPKDNLPYYVGITTFARDCGLYFIAGYGSEEEQEVTEQLIGQLSCSGIGGKRSSGYGKFEIAKKALLDKEPGEPFCSLYSMLSERHNTYMSLNLSLAKDDELDRAVEDGYFILVRRGGFVESEKYSNRSLKKKLIYAFGEGSCFKYAYKGCIADVSQGGRHPVYRFLKPFFLGVNL